MKDVSVQDYDVETRNIIIMRRYLKEMEERRKELDINEKATFCFSNQHFIFPINILKDISFYYKINLINGFYLKLLNSIDVLITNLEEKDFELLKILENERKRWIVFLLEELQLQNFYLNPIFFQKRYNKEVFELTDFDIAELIFEKNDDVFDSINDAYNNIVYPLIEKYPLKELTIESLFNLKSQQSHVIVKKIHDFKTFSDLSKKFKFNGVILNPHNEKYQNKLKNIFSNFYSGSGQILNF
jgi:hypothetical protein